MNKICILIGLVLMSFCCCMGVKSVGGGLFRVQVDGMYGYINARGSLIVEPRCKYGKEFSEGFALVLNDENEVNILNESGVSVARLGSVYGFLDASVFSEGLVCFKHQDRFVFINSCGVQPFGESFEDARGFSCGLACVKKDGLWGYVNKFGDWVIPNIYESAFCFEDGIAIVKSKLGFGLIDLRGKFVMNPNYTFILWAQNGLVSVCDGNESFVVDLDGNRVPGFAKYESAIPLCKGFYRVTDGSGKYGVVDALGNVLIPFVYDNIKSCSEDLFPVESEGKCGYIDLTGRIVIPLQFDCVDSFHNGLAAVVDSDTSALGYINRRGEWVWKPTK